MASLSDKRALVTGGSRGIGAAIVRRLARDGAHVAFTYGQSAGPAEDLVREVGAAGGRAFAIAADSADPAAVERSVREAAAGLGGLDILVNNAGVARGGPLEAMSLADIDLLIDVNIRGVVLAIRAAIPHLGRGGRIVTTGSCLAERVAMPGIAAYSMTKSALISLTGGLARDLGGRGITVNLVHPGPTDTDMNPAAGPQSEAQRAMIPLGRYGRAEDIAAAVAFLVGPEAGQINGTGLTVDGGLNA
ncbi:3-oxoacyl-ACP reductase FabG [Roseomonas sp. NAR14]|uniref:3-oxoacyl-ACP reductase FabG n=1 Tax=Roseomonas acroporae TaxID=2937791 RepID=A0A9X1Y821_9PROT|nr:3-oxoacyl-ACP reductase family protein [Roseomonas acroporae]MCK8785634.1 3-oxoacyl-ACP reductase FabG [Roseomonas acroporae]